jgi:K+-sensing histidine kinase KdpD
MFQRFFRANNASNIQGTGLEPNIVKRYVELLDGNISFQSKVSGGTTFTVEFPKQNQSNFSDIYNLFFLPVRASVPCHVIVKAIF